MKKWYLSKTLRVNALMFVAVLIHSITGEDLLTPEVQEAIIIVVNVILRFVTKEELI